VSGYLADALGTVRDVINDSGTVIDHVDYSAFGTVLDESSPSNSDRFVSFAGLERHTFTGLSLAVEREENPGSGRWLSHDLLGFAGGESNLHRYVGNSVTRYVDLKGATGLWAWSGSVGTEPATPVRCAPGHLMNGSSANSLLATSDFVPTPRERRASRV
jgi:RHS repeat-associated protein